jgi:plasmid maintenance system killer protein
LIPEFSSFGQLWTIIVQVLTIGDLAALPGNRFENLNGDRKGQCSTRINDQWRICFE